MTTIFLMFFVTVCLVSVGLSSSPVICICRSDADLYLLWPPLFILKLIVMSLMEQAFIMAVTCTKFIFKSYSAEWTVDVRFLNLSEPCHLGERKLGASSLHILPSSSRGGAKREKITTLGLWNRIYPLYNCWSIYFSNPQEFEMSLLFEIM